MVDYDVLRPEDFDIVKLLRARHPPTADFSTNHILRLLDSLGNPHHRLPPVIHVAGTNGKGSTVAFMRAIAEAAGMRVHVLTSPHLVLFAERIRLAGSLITEEYFAEVAARVERANAGLPISFAELTTALALLAFSEVPADLCIVEVGLGGRSDCTNVFDSPALSVITPIDFDHVSVLGPKLCNIAREKAGIIKRARPCVVAIQKPEADVVIADRARLLGARLVRMGRESRATEEHGRFRVAFGGQIHHLPLPSLFGPHQVDNAALAVTAMLELAGPRIPEEALEQGISSAIWPARFQELTSGGIARRVRATGARLFVDGGHNPHAARAIVRTLDRLRQQDERPVVLIVGMYERKDAQRFFSPFRGLTTKTFTVGFDAPGAAGAHELAALARLAGLPASPAPTLKRALSNALDFTEGGPPHILVCGGQHFVGQLLAKEPRLWPR
jgi:dihydrofolate synthase/folylpolyglutamate synthase